MSPIDQVQKWQEIFGGGPLAAFLGLTILAASLGWILYVRANGKLEKAYADHMATSRQAAALAEATEATWKEQLRQNEIAAELQQKSQQALERSVTLLEGRYGPRKPVGGP